MKIKELVELQLMNADVECTFTNSDLKSTFATGERVSVHLRKGHAGLELQFDRWRGYRTTMSVYFRNSSLVSPTEIYDTAYIMRLVVAISKAFEEL